MLHPSRQRGALAELLVAYRFVEAGHLVSWPLVPCAYDLVVDTGERLVRVQVKQASELQTPLGQPGHWQVKTTTRRGKQDHVVAVTALDYLCVVLRPEEVLVIPAAACASQQGDCWLRSRLDIGPESKYRVFTNLFSLGSATSGETPGAAIPPVRTAGAWSRKPRRRELGQRKEYRRLTPDVIAQIRQMPVRWYQHLPPEGLIPLEEIARQFDVHPATLRNTVLRRDRLDLKTPLPPDSSL